MRSAALALALALALAALALSGCESSQEKSAKLEKTAKAKAGLVRAQSIPLGSRVAHTSSKVEVTSALLLHGSEATAAVVTLHNLSPTALRDLPIEIDVHGAGGKVLYTNATPGLAPSLTEVPLLAAHANVEWIDDQVQASTAAAAVSARLGEGEAVHANVPSVSLEGHLTRDVTNGAEVEGEAVNHSSHEQRELVVDCVASRAGRTVAAGRAVLAQVPAHGSTRFQLFFVGNPAGARLQLSAPASTLG